MRKSKLTAQELEESELAEHQQRQQRNGGFSIRSVRDRGWGHIIDKKSNHRCSILWHVDNRIPGVYYSGVPAGRIVLVSDGKEMVFNVDELQKLLRWA